MTSLWHARPPMLINLLTTHVLLHTSTRTFVFQLLFHRTPPWYSLIPHALPDPIALSLQGLPHSLAVLSVSFSVLNFLTFLFHYDIFCFSNHDLFNYSPHFLLTLSPFRCRLLRIVLLVWGDCPRAGLFATATLSLFFFLLAAAWVDPGRNALQSAEQRC